METQHVIIIGAGATGLITASQIADKCDVTIVESNAYTGGRIKTLPGNSAGLLIEAGAEFVHGNTPVTNSIIKAAGLETVKLTGKMFRKEKGEWKEEEEMIEGWDELVEKMKGQREDMTMREFMDKYFPDEKYSSLRRHIEAFVQGFDVAGIDEVSVQSLYQEWAHEGDQFRIKTGYGSMINYLTERCRSLNCRIMMNQTVKKVDWRHGRVTVHASDGEKLDGDKVVITVPVGVLKNSDIKCAITLSPALDSYQHAINNIGFGTVIKIVFDINQTVWPEKTSFMFSSEQIPTWWTQYPLKNNLITGWAGGPAAARLAQHSDAELVELGVASLANICGIAAEKLRNIIVSSYVFNWSKNDESQGAYSFSTPDSASARKILKEPIAGTVFFAGEGLYEGPFSGTVEAALANGMDVAARLLKTLS